MRMMQNVLQGAVRVFVGMVMVSACLGVAAPAQQATVLAETGQALIVTIQVLDGRSGKPITANSISVNCLSGKDFCVGFKSPIFGEANDSGEMKIEVPASATQLVLGSSEDEYEFCGGYSFEESLINVSVIRSSGFLGKNDCKKLSAEKLVGWRPAPGRVVVFAHRKPWWVRMFPYC